MGDEVDRYINKSNDEVDRYISKSNYGGQDCSIMLVYTQLELIIIVYEFSFDFSNF